MNWSTHGNFFFSGLHSTHNNGREDRLFKPLLTRWGANQYAATWSGWLNNWDARFDYSCPHNKAVVGLISYHHNGAEDRRWRVRCAAFHGVTIHKNAWPGWQTNWDATWSIGCGHAPMVGLSSYHNNHREDRRFRIRCGRATIRL